MTTEKYTPKRKWWQLWKARSSPVNHVDAVVEHFQEQEMATYHALEDPAILNDAGIASFRRYQASGQVADLNRALEHWHEALDLTSPDSPYWLVAISSLGIGLQKRYERTGNL